MADSDIIASDFEAPDIRLEGVNVALTLEYIGEGNDGDYNPEDADDTPLYRFSTERRAETGEWEDVNDGSYCTQIPANCAPSDAQAAARYLLNCIEVNGTSKRFLEQLSWTSLQTVRDAEAVTA